ncbi:MAG TPA: ring-opening amidohydrolase [Kofleriaceae bacterium]
MKIRAFNLATSGPADVTGLRGLLDGGAVRAEDVLCVLGKTEGNGGRNDFTRELAMTALEHLFAPRLGIAPQAVQDRVIFSLSGGCEGVVTPHLVVFVREGRPGVERLAHKRLSAASGYTRSFAPEEIGTMAQIIETARAVAEVVAGLQVDSPADVHLVQMKGAIPAGQGPVPPRCDMVHSRAASALGAALALSEVPAAALSDAVVNRDFALYSSVASCSAKPGLARTEILAFGMSPFWDGDLVIDHGILTDILDLDGIRRVAAAVGLPGNELVGAFAKAEADPRGTVRGHRHTMLSDDDIGDTRYARCVLASVLAAGLGETRVYVSTRAEHHGPLGGGPLALLARVPPTPS